MIRIHQVYQNKNITLITKKTSKLQLRWWLHDPLLREWKFNPSSRNRFHATITWGNQFSSRKCSYMDFFKLMCWFTFSSHLGGLKRLHGIPAVHKRDPALPRWNLLHVIARYNLWRIFNTSGISAKRDRISSQSTGIM